LKYLEAPSTTRPAKFFMPIVPSPLMGRIFTEPAIMKIYTAPLMASKKFFLVKSEKVKTAARPFSSVAPPASKKCSKAFPNATLLPPNTKK